MMEESLQMKPEYANVHDPLVIAITNSLKETLTTYYVVSQVPREISQVCQCEVQRVSNYKRYTGNHINGGGKKTPPAVFKTLYWGTTQSPKYQKIRSSKYNEVAIYQ